MGVYDTLFVEDGVELPKFPRDRSPTEVKWQTKDIGHPCMRTFNFFRSGVPFLKEQRSEHRERVAQ